MNTSSEVPHNPIEPLNEREIDVLRLIAHGLTDREIAQELILALDTVKWYNKRIYTKLNVKNRTEAVKQAREFNLLADQQAGDNNFNNEEISTTPPHNIPATLTPFIGRTLEHKDIIELLTDSDIRLITILAIGGMGKTRLALEVAKSVLPNFANGVYFIALAGLRETDHIMSNIVAGLGVQLSSSSQLTEQLLDYLRDKQICLILDNFEHLLDGADLLSQLLQASPASKIIVTSRERLNLHGETIYALSGLTLPRGNLQADIRSSSAVQLFEQRAKMSGMSSITEHDLPSIVDICKMVGGMPLGIELAASLVELISPSEIAQEITKNADILSTEMRDVPQRLRSIRVVFDFSWSRLSENEQRVYSHLALFRDGFTRDAAETIAQADLRTLISLANKSLLQRDPTTDRYSIHELLRQYAEEKLDNDEKRTTQNSYIRYYAQRMAHYAIDIQGHAQLDALNQIEADFENIRTVWQLAVELEDYDALNQCLEALYWFSNIRARRLDGENLFKLARANIDIVFDAHAHPVQRRLLLHFDASGENYRTQIEQMLAVMRENGNQTEIAFFLWMLGVNRYISHDFERAIDLFEEALDLFRQLKKPFYQIEVLHLIRMCKRMLDAADEAQILEEEMLQLSQQSGNQFALARVLGSRGLLNVYEGNDKQAEQDLRQAISIRKELGDTAGIIISMSSLGQIAFYRGDFNEAKSLAQESSELAANTHNLFARSINLNLRGLLACVAENYQYGWDLCMESFTRASDPTLYFVSFLGLAMAACGLEDYASANDYMRRGLSVQSMFQTPKSLSLYLPVLAVLYANQGKLVQSVEVLALAFHHPQSSTGWMRKWALLDRLQSFLEEELGNEAYHAAWQHGMQGDLDTTLTQWLNELSSLN